MKNTGLLLACTALLLSSCVKTPLGDDPQAGNISFQLQTKEAREIETKTNAHENDIREVYLIVFDGASDTYLECKPATKLSGDSYTAPLLPRASAVKIVAVANVASLVQAQQSSWTVGVTTGADVSGSLLTPALATSGGAIVSMPELAPLSAQLSLNKIDQVMTIAAPFVLERATAKITISNVAPNFTLLGANLCRVPTQGYVLPGQSAANLESIPRVNTAGPDGADSPICAATPADPLYCYETTLHTDPAQHPFVIIRSDRGYYRINLTDKAGQQLSLQRNYYYKINIKQIVRDGATTAAEAENDPALNADIEVNDPDSHEIISDGVNYLGLTNSEYVIYDSHALNEFNMTAFDNGRGCDYESINGFDVATLTYTSPTGGEVTCIECTTASGGTQTSGIRFQNSAKGVWDAKATVEEQHEWGNLTDKLTLAATTTATARKIIVNIPHDLVQAKLQVSLGGLKKEIVIQRKEVISFLGDTLDLGTGYSTAKVGFEKAFFPKNYQNYETPLGYPIPVVQESNTSDMIHFSTTLSGWSPSLFQLNPSDKLYVKINPLGNDKNMMFDANPNYNGRASEFYLTRDADQTRVRVHLIQEAFRNGAKDAQGCGSTSYNYCAAFWRNDQSGERIIRVYKTSELYYWTARVVYGEDFIRLAPTDSRTVGTGYAAVTSGDPEDHTPDATWKTFLENPFTKGPNAYPQFRIGLTSPNPDPSKPRYGLVVFSVPYSAGSGSAGQTFLIFVRQGEEPDYLFSKTDLYEGAPRSYAQAFAPYNLTVPDPANHPGGANFADHKSMNGSGVFTQYPTQQGYLYQWGSDIAIHPTNPGRTIAITGYDYNYNASYTEICPAGYTLPQTDDANSAIRHSLLDPTVLRERGGLCADGYFDRQAYTFIPNTSSITMGDGGATGRGGAVFYNKDTRASLFVPEGSRRSDTGLLTTGTNYYWGNDPAQTGNNQSFVYTPQYVPPGSYGLDRKHALPVRCVKKATP